MTSLASFCRRIVLPSILLGVLMPVIVVAAGIEPNWRDTEPTSSGPNCSPPLLSTSKFSSIAVDPNGDVYLGCAGGGWRIVKWRPSTQAILWEKTFNFTTLARRVEIAIDTNKSVYMSGIVTSAPVGVVKVDSNGREISDGFWPKSVGRGSVFVDKDNFVYVGDVVRVYKYDTAGNEIASNIISSRDIIDIAVDRASSVYVLGMGASGETVIQKYGPNGVPDGSWGSGGEARFSDIPGQPKSLVLDETHGAMFATGNTVCCGTWNGYVVKFNLVSGSVIGSAQLGIFPRDFPFSTMRARDVAVDSLGDVYVGGYAAMDVGNQGLGATSADIGFIAKYNSSLERQFIQMVRAVDVATSAVWADTVTVEAIAINPTLPNKDKIFAGGYLGHFGHILNGPFGLGFTTDVPPSSPGGVRVSAGSGPGCHTITLSWNANSELDIRSYRIYRNSGSGAVLLTTLPFSQTSYSDPNLDPTTTYSYQVEAVDMTGNVSPRSAGASAKPNECPDTTSPGVPSITSISAGASCHDVNLSWSAVIDNSGGSGLKGYNVYRNGIFIKQVSAPQTSTSDSGLAGSTNYSYQVEAEDNARNKSTKSVSRSVTTSICPVPDTTPPNPPSGISAAPKIVNGSASCSIISIQWLPATDNVGGSGIKGYNVYRNNVKINSTLILGILFDDIGRASETSYTYEVTAVDNVNLESLKSLPAIGTTPSCPKPDLTIAVPPTIAFGTPQQGQLLAFSGVIKNQGGSIASGFHNRFYIDLGNDNTGSINLGNGSFADVSLGANPAVMSLAPSAVQGATSVNWTAQSGTHRVIVCADYDNLISEINEMNNCSRSASGFGVGNPSDGVFDVPITSFTLSAIPSTISVLLGGSSATLSNASIVRVIPSGMSSSVDLSVSQVCKQGGVCTEPAHISCSDGNCVASSTSSVLPNTTFMFNPSSLSSAVYSTGSQLKALVPGNAMPGSYRITVVGTSGSIVSSVVVTLTAVEDDVIIHEN